MMFAIGFGPQSAAGMYLVMRQNIQQLQAVYPSIRILGISEIRRLMRYVIDQIPRVLTYLDWCIDRNLNTQSMLEMRVDARRDSPYVNSQSRFKRREARHTERMCSRSFRRFGQIRARTVNDQALVAALIYIVRVSDPAVRFPRTISAYSQSLEQPAWSLHTLPTLDPRTMHLFFHVIDIVTIFPWRYGMAPSFSSFPSCCFPHPVQLYRTGNDSVGNHSLLSHSHIPTPMNPIKQKNRWPLHDGVIVRVFDDHMINFDYYPQCLSFGRSQIMKYDYFLKIFIWKTLMATILEKHYLSRDES